VTFSIDSHHHFLHDTEHINRFNPHPSDKVRVEEVSYDEMVATPFENGGHDSLDVFFFELVDQESPEHFLGQEKQVDGLIAINELEQGLFADQELLPEE
jgi:hypothetical protein